jgi:hypothetical protein
MILVELQQRLGVKESGNQASAVSFHYPRGLWVRQHGNAAMVSLEQELNETAVLVRDHVLPRDLSLAVRVHLIALDPGRAMAPQIVASISPLVAAAMEASSPESDGARDIPTLVQVAVTKDSSDGASLNALFVSDSILWLELYAPMCPVSQEELPGVLDRARRLAELTRADCDAVTKMLLRGSPGMERVTQGRKYDPVSPLSPPAGPCDEVQVPRADGRADHEVSSAKSPPIMSI